MIKKNLRRLAFELESRLSGQESLLDDPVIEKTVDEILKNYDFYKLRIKKKAAKADWLKIYLKKLATSENRSLRPELVAEYGWNLLGMEKILKDAGMDQKKIPIAKALIFAKLISPSSEASTLQWIKKRSSLAEIIDKSLLEIKKDPLYETGGSLFYLKDYIEKSLAQKEEDLFATESTLYLYDLTNSYFEGACASNGQAKRGRSKDKQNRRPLMTLALLVDSRGYPIFSQIYKGNTS